MRGREDNRFIGDYPLFISAILRPCLAYIFAFILETWIDRNLDSFFQ